MQRKKISKLVQIARMKQEMELSDLVRLARDRDALHARRTEIITAEQAARRAATSLEGARLAEGFSGWVQSRQTEVDNAIQKKEEEVLRQKEKAAIAVGRHDAIHKIDIKLGVETLRDGCR
ncbi:hypothetical protein [Paenirhodobacter sp.]|uniref:hypothetical protein n=1 Tax=Paenirhodobacter sp. TaxID=1965326 RepID=UPI003B3F1AB8